MKDYIKTAIAVAVIVFTANWLAFYIATQAVNRIMIPESFVWPH